MTIECIILDFDGTFTEVEAEAVPFVRGFREGLEDAVGPESAARWDGLAARVAGDPATYGWENEGHIVAPSHADPYIFATSVAQLLLAELGMGANARADLIQTLYKTNYPKSQTVFRSDAKRVVEAVIASGVPVFVVTNSLGDHVAQKLTALAPIGLERLAIRGDARKYVLTEPTRSSETWKSLFATVGETLQIPGLARPIHRRRGLYFDALTRIWDETHTLPENTLVCGDIFELDLALPAALGASTHLVARASTPEYERRAARTLPGGGTTTELAGVLARLDMHG